MTNAWAGEHYFPHAKHHKVFFLPETSSYLRNSFQGKMYGRELPEAAMGD